MLRLSYKAEEKSEGEQECNSEKSAEFMFNSDIYFFAVRLYNLYTFLSSPWLNSFFPPTFNLFYWEKKKYIH